MLRLNLDLKNSVYKLVIYLSTVVYDIYYYTHKGTLHYTEP